ncbi:hypothetical protein HK096_008634 [Nowakowskiella sp. JEL0078]|nr:hypothetical protein HK096_008634 [Nowakowskiella sp. JEL0078]
MKEFCDILSENKTHFGPQDKTIQNSISLDNNFNDMRDIKNFDFQILQNAKLGKDSYTSARQLSICIEWNNNGISSDLFNALIYAFSKMEGINFQSLGFIDLSLSSQSTSIISSFFSLSSQLQMNYMVQRIQKLVLKNCGVGGSGIVLIGNTIIQSKLPLKILDISGNVGEYDPRAFEAAQAIARLVQTIERNKFCQLSDLFLNDNNFTTRGLSLILNTLSSTQQITILELSNTNIGPCISDLALVLQTNSSITKLNISRNGLLSRTLNDFLNQFHKNFHKACYLELNISENYFNNDCLKPITQLFSLMCLSKLELSSLMKTNANYPSLNVSEIDYDPEVNVLLAGCTSDISASTSPVQFSDLRCADIISALCSSRSAKTIRSINFSHHHFGDNTCEVVPFALQSCTEIVEIIVQGNCVSDKGVQMVIEGIEKVSKYRDLRVFMDFRYGAILSGEIKKLSRTWNLENKTGSFVFC